MAKSARRRNAKKTIGKKRGAKGYRRKTMRKRKKGGMEEGRVVDAKATTPSARRASASASTTPLSARRASVSASTTPLSPISTKSGVIKPMGRLQPRRLEQEMEMVKYNIVELPKTQKWLVTIITSDDKKESYTVPKDILGRVHPFTEI